MSLPDPGTLAETRRALDAALRDSAWALADGRPERALAKAATARALASVLPYDADTSARIALAYTEAEFACHAAFGRWP